MTTGYYVDDKPLEDLVAKKSDALQQMITSSNFFTLPEYNLNGQFGSASPNYNGATWGVPIDTGYYKEGSRVPFIDSKSVPNPYLVKKSDGTFVRQFPESDWTNNYGTWGKFILGSDIDASGIEISYADGMLLVKKGSTELINTKASPYILFDIQAPGGAGGHGRGDWNYWYFSERFALSGGGGGSSGCFVSLSAKLDSNNKITVKDPKDSTYYEVTCAADTEATLQIGKGVDGSIGSCNAYNDGKKFSLRASGGKGGAMGEPNIPTRGNILFNNNIFVTEAYAGNKGADGASTTSSWVERDEYTTSGNSAGSITSDILLTSVSTSKISCTLYNSETSASGGCGELASAAAEAGSPLIAGGGGGGASLMANGASHPTNPPGIGAGGWGGSAWTSDKNQLFGVHVKKWSGGPDEDAITEANTKQPGGAGGPGAMWIYYIPVVDILDPVIVDNGSTDDGGNNDYD